MQDLNPHASRAGHLGHTDTDRHDNAQADRDADTHVAHAHVAHTHRDDHRTDDPDHTHVAHRLRPQRLLHHPQLNLAIGEGKVTSSVDQDWLDAFTGTTTVELTTDITGTVYALNSDGGRIFFDANNNRVVVRDEDRVWTYLDDGTEVPEDAPRTVASSSVDDTVTQSLTLNKSAVHENANKAPESVIEALQARFPTVMKDHDDSNLRWSKATAVLTAVYSDGCENQTLTATKTFFAPPPANSDIRLKKDIVALNDTAGGFQLYAFRYIDAEKHGSGYYVGVMAQEVKLTRPDAVLDGAFYRVDYAALGIKMMTLDEYRASKHNQARSS